MSAYEIALAKKQEQEAKRKQEQEAADIKSAFNKKEEAALHQIIENLLNQFDGKGFKRVGYSLEKDGRSVAEFKVEWEPAEESREDGNTYYSGACYRIYWTVSVCYWNSSKSGIHYAKDSIEKLEQDFGEAMVEHL